MLKGMRRHLSNMAYPAVNALQEGKERFAKYPIIVGAPAPPRGLELHILYPARGAGQSREFVRLPADVLADDRLQNRGQVQLLLLEQLLLFCAFLAEMPFPLFAVHEIGQVNRRWLSARLAIHE